MLERYVARVRLLVDVLPDIAREFAFALKGGTAINLFYRDMPRLSVDVDLTWLPVGDRASALSDISSALDRIGAMITERNPRLTVHRIAGGGLSGVGGSRGFRWPPAGGAGVNTGVSELAGPGGRGC